MRHWLFPLWAAACATAEHTDPDRTTPDDTAGTKVEGTELPDDTEGTGATVDPADPFDEADFDPILLTPQAQTIAQAHNAFALDLLAEATQGSEDDVIFSPFSLFSAFSMVWAGAEGQTADELAAALHIDPLAAPSWHSDYSAVMAALTEADPEGRCDLGVANRLFGDQGLSFEAPFVDSCAQDYDAPLEVVDFSDPEAARDEINAWVADQTDQRIVDLLPEGAVTSLTALVLANAVTFAGSWSWAFDPDQTEDAAFTLFGGEVVEVPTMSQTLDLPFHAHDGAWLTRLPYGCGDLSMIVIVPAPGAGDIREIEERIDAQWLEEATSAWEVLPAVELRLPKLDLVQDLDVQGAMTALGVEELWGADADLSGMVQDVPLFVSGVHHRAVLTVDEAGTTAAGATTEVVTADTGALPAVFAADAPFLVLIRDEAAGIVLFAGRVADPRP